MGLKLGKQMRVRLKYFSEDVDRHDNVRCYVRLPGKRKVRIHALPGTPEFLEEYQAAIAAAAIAPMRQANESKKDSLRYLCIRYYASAAYRALDGSTQNWQRRALDEIAREHGAKPVATMQARNVRRIRDAKIETPAAANQRIKALRAMFSWANEAGETGVNPTIGVKKLKYRSDGHHTWTDEEIQRYYDRHPLGTQARLALDLLRYTAGRREDAPRLGRQHIREGRVRFRQAKNEHRNPIDIDILVHPALAESIAAAEVSNRMIFLLTEFGKPFTANGFGNKFKDWCRQADLPRCSAHGVRKATSTALAEASATPHEIMAITGHQTLEEVERYTRAASRKKTADAAMRKLII
ncbi:tyrosine-type recombinase/integrase [Bradyrhizobium sp. AUGA SZCCT0182]|uniref:tyrosine-type recombinase/integrase n=1 Tax=Bradyrhizobium sp. AUGA SZCCT0182 TaxID=2807667 RepID=UPI0020138E0B|nr:tyrosine-type recombinase/integrase [Bradyrhizobium sp. AUGA SZCCT0182]